MKKIILFITLLLLPFYCYAEEIDINVNNTDEAIKAIDEVYNDREPGKFNIRFSENTVDVDRVNEYYKEKYITDISINTYKYSDYAYIQPIRFLPILNENSFFLDNLNKKITKEEKQKLEKFTEKFLPLFKGKTDYEKVYMAYSYISTYAVYQSEGTFENLIDAYVSAYDVLIDHKAVCLGSATAFSYLMDKLGIESYIVDQIGGYDSENRTYYSVHTYNVVKLDNKWYIVDIKYGNDFSGLLISNKNYQNDKYNYDVVVSETDYERPEFSYTFDNDKINSIINNLDKEEKKDKKEEKKDESIYYIVLVLILIIILLVIILFTRKKDSIKSSVKKR